LSSDECLRVLREIERYLDGELEAALRLEIHRHLEACSPCMDHSEFKRALKELLRAKCGCDVVPPEVLVRIRAALEGSARPPEPGPLGRLEPS
jgi:mycothiol system anti-sigma-R factor